MALAPDSTLEGRVPLGLGPYSLHEVPCDHIRKRPGKIWKDVSLAM